MRQLLLVHAEGVCQEFFHFAALDVPLVLGIIQLPRKTYLLVNDFVEEGGKCNDEFSKVYNLVVVGVEEAKEVAREGAVGQFERLAELREVDDAVVFLTF